MAPKLVAGLVVAAVLGAGAAGATEEATVVSDTTDSVALTIYPDDLALVTETRTVALPAGRSTVRFAGVPDLILPQSLILQQWTGASLERNFDYDLLGKASLWEASVGGTVELTRIDPASGDVVRGMAEVVSAGPDQGVVVRTEAGLEGLFCSGLATRASFGGLPPGLAARPAMTVELVADRAGPQEIVLSYLTRGLEWEADYRLEVGEENALAGWITVDNGTSRRFEDIDLSVIAGRLNRVDSNLEVPGAEYQRAMCWPRSGGAPFTSMRINSLAPIMVQEAMTDLSDGDEIVVTGARIQAVQEEVGDYKLYRIPRALTVGAMQTKQLLFLSEPGVEAAVVLVLDPDTMEDKAGNAPFPLRVRRDVDNSRDGALGKPLPRGGFSVFGRAESGRRVFLGADRVENLPVGEDAEVQLGTSAVVFATSERVDSTSLSDTYRVTLVNSGDAPATVEWEEARGPNMRVRGAERVEDEDLPTWRVVLEPNSRRDVTIVRVD